MKKLLLIAMLFPTMASADSIFLKQGVVISTVRENDRTWVYFQDGGMQVFKKRPVGLVIGSCQRFSIDSRKYFIKVEDCKK